LTFQLRAAEERVQELEVEAAHFREQAARAEDWLQHIKESGGSRQTGKSSCASATDGSPSQRL
jgi:hypothetical protein